MRILILCMIFPSLFTSPTSQNIRTISQSFFIENYTTSIIAQLNGAVEVVYWDGDELVVETTIFDTTPGASDYTLNYSINKGGFELECSPTDDVNTMILQPKKINRTIFRRGHKQKTEQTYKLFIPKRLQYSIQ